MLALMKASGCGRGAGKVGCERRRAVRREDGGRVEADGGDKRMRRRERDSHVERKMGFVLCGRRVLRARGRERQRKRE